MYIVRQKKRRSFATSRTRRPGAGNVDSGSFVFTPFHQSTSYNTPFCGLSPPCGSSCTLSKDAPPDWAGRRFNSPLQATAAATGNGHSGRHALGKTPTTPIAFKDSSREIYRWKLSMVWFGLVASSDLRPTLVVPRHPSLQSTRTRRPGGRKRRQCIRIYTIPPVHHLQYPILWTKPTMRTLQQLPSFKGRPTRLGRATLQLATAGNCSGHRKRALRQTCSREDPDNTICVQRLKPRDLPMEVVNGLVRPRGLI